MNKQSITIEIPEGKEAKQVTNPDGSISITFVDKEPVRSKSWKEFCKNHPICQGEYYINSNGVVHQLQTNWNRDTKQCDNHLRTLEDAEGILALIQLTRLHDEWVEGSEYKKFSTKAYIYVTEKETLNICVGEIRHFLDFPTSVMATEFLKCFEDLILKAKKFL